MAWTSVIWGWHLILPHIWMFFVKRPFYKELQKVLSLIAFFEKCRIAYLPSPWFPTDSQGFTRQFIRYTTISLARDYEIGQQVCMPKCVTFQFLIAEWRITATAACCVKTPYFSLWKNSLKFKILWFFESRPHHLSESIAKNANFNILTPPGGVTLTKNSKKIHFFKGCGEKMAITR